MVSTKKNVLFGFLIFGVLFTVGDAVTDIDSPDLVYDVCVYGGTPSGILAAVAVARAGNSVVIVEPSRRLGGMLGGGIRPNRDTRHPADIGGLTRKIMEIDANMGGHIFVRQPEWRQEWVKLVHEYGIDVVYNHRLSDIRKTGTDIHTIVLDYAPPEADGCPIPYPIRENAKRVSAKVFIDAGYEGDLMAMAGVSYVVGREAVNEFNESLAGQRNLRVFDVSPYVIPDDPSSGLLPMIDDEPFEEGAASRHIMAYNFRFLLGSRPGQGTPVGQPDHYDPRMYALAHRAWQKYPKMIGWPHDNYNRRTLISTGIPGRQSDYPEGTWPERAKIWRQWIDHAKIMHHFVTGSDRELRLGHYPEGGDFPDCLYVRVARRMRGRYVMTQHDLMLQREIDDSIGLSYGFKGWVDIYPARLVATEDGKVATEGEMSEVVSPGPYRIPYRAITPKAQECTNLLVPVCASATHIAMSSIRMEGSWMLMGESAGIAAAQAIEQNVAVQDIHMPQYRRRLLLAGQILEWDGYGDQYGVESGRWWHKHPEDYARYPVEKLLKGPLDYAVCDVVKKIIRTQ